MNSVSMEESAGRHSVAILLQAVCPVLGVDPQRAIGRAGWSESEQPGADFMVSGASYLTLWDSIVALAGEHFDPIFLGKAMANGPVLPIFLGFAIAPDLREAMRRFARYKSLFGPISISLSDHADGLRIQVSADDTDLCLPASLLIPFSVFLVEKARNNTARQLVPKYVSFPEGVIEGESVEQYFGGTVKRRDQLVIEFRAADARLPFLSENPTLWHEIETDLERQLLSRQMHNSFDLQVEAAIRRALNIGLVRVEAICDEFRMSRSTFQRRLRKAGRSYQVILDEVRTELASRYLTKSTLTVAQIALLVGFSDPKSFHRWFKLIEGMAPEAFRQLHQGSLA